MSNYIHILKENPVFELVAKSASDLNFPTYVIGGFVRDMLLKRSQKSKDIDFVCVGSGVKLAEQVAKNSKKDLKVTTFQRFGTAMLKIGDWFYLDNMEVNGVLSHERYLYKYWLVDSFS